MPAQDVYNIGIITRGEGTVKLGDIAEIRSTFKENETYARIDGKPAIHLDVKKSAFKFRQMGGEHILYEKNRLINSSRSSGKKHSLFYTYLLVFFFSPHLIWHGHSKKTTHKIMSISTTF